MAWKNVTATRWPSRKPSRTAWFLTLSWDRVPTDWAGSCVITVGGVWFTTAGALMVMGSYLAMLPEENIGVVILSNLDEGNSPVPVTYEVFDRLLSVAPAPLEQALPESRRQGKSG